MSLTLGSLFDGIGGFPLAGALAGIKTLWAAEIEPSCIAVTRNHFPDVEHLGSVTDIDGAKIPPVDIIAFGSPCQDLSVAGKQAGLDGERSGLFNEAIRIIYEMREATNGRYPTFAIWENVPGAFNSNKGHDFLQVLRQITKANIPMPECGKWAKSGMVQCGGVQVAWRQLDAQYWGVPQRRKRIFLVADFGGFRAEQILFKPESLPWNFKKGGTPRERASANAETSTSIRCYDARGNGDGQTSHTITGDHENRITDYTNIVVQSCTVDKRAVVYAIDRAGFNQGINARYDFEITDNGINSTLVAKGPSAVAYEIKKWIVRRLMPLECERLQGFPNHWTETPKIKSLSDNEYKFWLGVYERDKQIRGKKYKTPTKEQLIKWYNKLDCDGNRYKMLGNSVAIPCVFYVLNNIAELQERKNQNEIEI